MDPISLSDDDSSSSDVIELQEESNDDVIEICEIRDYTNDYKNNGQYDDIVKESKLLGEFIEKCLDLESTKGMVRVINRSLITAYYSTTEEFRNSEMFTKVMSRSICKLDSDPDHKFSHVKELCQEMKEACRKLQEKLQRRSERERKEKIIGQHIPKKRGRKKTIGWPFKMKKRKPNDIENIIVSDDDENSVSFEVPIVNLDEHASVATISDVPFSNDNQVNNDAALIEVEIDGVNKVFTEPSDLNKENLNNNKDSHVTLTDEIIDIKFDSHKTHLSSTENETCSYNNNASQSLLKDVNLEPLQRISDHKAIDCDNEVSSTEITSTVPQEDECFKGSQDSDLIVLDDENQDTQTITQEVGKEKNSVNSDGNNSVIIDYEFKNCINEVAKDVIVLVEENDIVTTTKDITQDLDTETPKDVANSIQQNNDLIVIDDEDDLDTNAPNNNCNVVDSVISDENKLLVPHKAEVFEGTTEDKLMARIKHIEAEIAEYKSRITVLEEQEVDNDSMWSPYIQCEKYKEKIVKLYTELCKLTGEQAIKRREVRLKAASVSSQLCVEKLEDLINSNIGPDGLPHFPDFQDVLLCVKRANKEADLGWNRDEITREANALFTYCGRALQESRKRREWRDMLSLVKSEAIEDPADNDPELMARLQANKQTAVKRENDLLNRYTEMTYLQPSTECTKDDDSYDSDSENDSENDEDTDITSTSIQDRVGDATSQHSYINNIMDEQCSSNKHTTMEVLAQKLVEAVFNKPNIHTNGVTQEDVKSVVKSHVNVRKRCTPIRLDGDKPNIHATNSEPDIGQENKNPFNILNHNFELVPKVVVQKLNLPTVENPDGKHDITSVLQEKDSSDSGEIKIKKEPLVDIQDELNRLGTDFTATVIHIQDPFLVIEISSDSEDEDDGFTENVRDLL